MPEGRITRLQVREHLRRLWAVYLIGAVVLCFLNHVVFTVTRPGFSADETLKIMLLNADVSLPEDELLSKTGHLGFRAVETLEMFVSPKDETSRMLLITQLISGEGDICITDAAGLDVLNERKACYTIRELSDGLYLAALNPEQNVQAALEILIDKMGE